MKNKLKLTLCCTYINWSSAEMLEYGMWQGTIVYQVVGDLTAPNYFWVDNAGNVFVRIPLTSDTTSQYTVSFLVIV